MGSEVKPGVKIIGVKDVKITGVRLKIKGLTDLKLKEVGNNEVSVKVCYSKDLNETTISIEFKIPLTFARKNIDKAVEKALTILENLHCHSYKTPEKGETSLKISS